MIPENKSVTLNENYIRETHRIGKISDAIAVILILMVPTVITLVYGKGIDIDMSKTMGAIITLTAVYGVVSVVEVVSTRSPRSASTCRLQRLTFQSSSHLWVSSTRSLRDAI